MKKHIQESYVAYKLLITHKILVTCWSNDIMMLLIVKNGKSGCSLPEYMVACVHVTNPVLINFIEHTT